MKNLPAKLLVAVGALAFIGAICTSTAAPFAGTVEEWSPENQVAAQATATAIAPEIEPTRQYIERVLPTQQAVEAQEIEQTTRNAYDWQRKTTAAGSIVKMMVLGAFGVACVGVGVGVGGFASAKGIKEARQAMLPPTRQLAEGPHVTAFGTITHTATGGTWRIDAPSDALPEHARLVSPTYKAIPTNILVDLVNAQRAEWEKVKLLEAQND